MPAEPFTVTVSASVPPLTTRVPALAVMVTSSAPDSVLRVSVVPEPTETTVTWSPPAPVLTVLDVAAGLVIVMVSAVAPGLRSRRSASNVP